MNREEAVQQAREWRETSPSAEAVAFTERYEDGHWIRVDRVDYLLAAYAADRVRVELESLAKEMCDLCAHGVEFNGRDHFQPAAIGGIYSRCGAAPIRARLELLEGRNED